MTEQMQEEISKGDEAEDLLNKIRPYFIAYNGELFKSLKASSFKETEKREEIYRQLKSLDTIEAKITTSIQTGKMAREQLSLMDKCKNRLKVI